MERRTRRTILRSCAGLALATTVAGCTDDRGGVAVATGGIPGVEDGEIVDHHAFATAHDDQLATRTGTLEGAGRGSTGKRATPSIIRSRRFASMAIASTRSFQDEVRFRTLAKTAASSTSGAPLPFSSERGLTVNGRRSRSNVTGRPSPKAISRGNRSSSSPE